MMPTCEQRHVPSPFRKLLLTDVYDGPKAGLAIDASGDMYTFEMLDWDDAHDIRVFRLAQVPGLNWRDVEASFRTEEPEDWTEWVLPVSLAAPAEEALQRAERSAQLVAVIATSDLLNSIAVWRPLTALPAESPSPRWLEMLGLSRSRQRGA